MSLPRSSRNSLLLLWVKQSNLFHLDDANNENLWFPSSRTDFLMQKNIYSTAADHRDIAFFIGWISLLRWDDWSLKAPNLFSWFAYKNPTLQSSLSVWV